MTPVGIKNIGNSCFLNAVIQLLFHSRGLREFIKTLKPSKSKKPGELVISAIKRYHRSVDVPIEHLYH